MKKVSLILIIFIISTQLSGCLSNEQKANIIEQYQYKEYRVMEFLTDNKYQVDDLYYDDKNNKLSYTINSQIAVENTVKSEGELIGTIQMIVSLECEDNPELYLDVAKVMNYSTGTLSVDEAKIKILETETNLNFNITEEILANIEKNNGKLKVTITGTVK